MPYGSGGAVGFENYVIFNAATGPIDTTWLVPFGVTTIRVDACGAGGNGGSGNSVGGGGGGGGSSGACVSGVILETTPNSYVHVVVGWSQSGSGQTYLEIASAPVQANILCARGVNGSSATSANGAAGGGISTSGLGLFPNRTSSGGAGGVGAIGADGVLLTGPAYLSGTALFCTGAGGGANGFAGGNSPTLAADFSREYVPGGGSGAGLGGGGQGGSNIFRVGGGGGGINGLNGFVGESGSGGGGGAGQIGQVNAGSFGGAGFVRIWY